jgi:hypothetical protein
MDSETPINLDIHQIVIKILTPDDEVVLPDLPFVESSGRISLLKEGVVKS